MFCTKCGAQLQDDAKFCTACGARVAHPNAACAQAATCEANLEEAAPLPPNPSADMATDAHAPETTPNANSTDNVSPTHAATNPGDPKRRPRWRGIESNAQERRQANHSAQPPTRSLVVLVALALALAAGNRLRRLPRIRRRYRTLSAAGTNRAGRSGRRQAKRARPARRKRRERRGAEVTEAPANILQVSRVLALGSEGEQFITTHGASSKTAATETPWVMPLRCIPPTATA